MRSQWIQFPGDRNAPAPGEPGYSPTRQPPSRLLIVGIWDDASVSTVEGWARPVLELGVIIPNIHGAVEWEEIVRVGKEHGIIVPAPEGENEAP